MSDTTPPGPPEMLGASDQLFPSLIFASEVRVTELEEAPLQGFMVATPVLRSVVSLQFHCVH